MHHGKDLTKCPDLDMFASQDVFLWESARCFLTMWKIMKTRRRKEAR